LWYLEAYLNETSQNIRHNPEAYELCCRIYDTCRKIVFCESPNSARSSYSHADRRGSRIDLANASLAGSAHVPPTIVGIGAIVASTASPSLAKSVRQLLFTQGRQKRIAQDLYYPIEDLNANTSSNNKALSPSATSPSLDELAKGDAFSLDTFLSKTNTRLSEIFRGSSGFRKISTDVPGKFLSTHYFYAEMQFILALIDIADRLRSVSKSSRQNSLIAELTLLNHNFPADICVPFCCSASPSNTVHHKIVRISLSDCVVLNSAERVPYLVTLEVLENNHKAAEHEEDGIALNGERDIEDDEEENKDGSSQSSENTTLKTDLKIDTKAKATDNEDFADRMKTAAVMLAQLYQQQQKDAESSSDVKSKSLNNYEFIRARVIQEMMALEQKRIAADGDLSLSPTAGPNELINTTEDPSGIIFLPSPYFPGTVEG
jgi:hypothetical protein